MLPDDRKPIYLMEGGPFRGDETASVKKLQAKTRLYSIMFSKLLISSPDFIESNKLFRVAERDKTLWTKSGIISIALPNDVDSLDNYIDKRVVSGRRPVDRGRKGRSVRKVRDEAKERCMAIGNDIPTQIFDVKTTRKIFRENTLTILEQFGKHIIADRLKDTEDFYRGLIMECLEGHQEYEVQAILKRVNSYYYMAAAMQMNAACGIQRGYTNLIKSILNDEQNFNETMLLGAIGNEGIEYMIFLERLLKKTFNSLELDPQKLLSLDDEKFVELLKKKETKRFRSRLSKLADAAKSKSITESDTISTVEEFISAFESILAVHIQRERKIIKGKEKSDTAVKVIPIISGITIANVLIGVEIIPFAGILAGASAFSTFILEPCLKRIYESFFPNELSLFAESYRKITL